MVCNCVGDRCSILIEKVTQHDKGIYKVMARNQYGEAASECTLHVEGELGTRSNYVSFCECSKCSVDLDIYLVHLP